MASPPPPSSRLRSPPSYRRHPGGPSHHHADDDDDEDNDPWSTSRLAESPTGASRRMTWGPVSSHLEDDNHGRARVGGGGAVDDSGLGTSSTPASGASSVTSKALPGAYNEAWRAAGGSESGHGLEEEEEQEISLGQLNRVLGASGLPASSIEKIVNLGCRRPRCSRVEFAICLAMVAHAQSGMEPNPDLAYAALSSPEDLPVPRLALQGLPPSSSFRHGAGNGADDLWGVPAVARPAGITPSLTSSRSTFAPWGVPPALEERDESASETPVRQGARQHDGLPASSSSASISRRLGVGAGEEDANDAQATSGDIGFPARFRPKDVPHVRLLAETGGYLFIRHSLYTIACRALGTSVTRRYSDFDWLADCLVKKYIFRMLPVLPPKRLTLPVGKSLTGDDAFTEQRRRGLQRYCRALLTHPVLREDPLVKVFLSEAKSMAEWRATHSSPDLSDESFGEGTALPPGEQGVPSDIDDKWDKAKKACGPMLERWNGLVLGFDRMVKRTEALSADYSRVALGVSSLVEQSRETWKPENQPKDLVESGMERIGKAETDLADVLGARSQALTVTTLEGLKTQRDLWQSFRELAHRLDAKAPDNIDALHRRIEATQRRNTAWYAERRPGWEAECDKMRRSVKEDEERIEVLLRRRKMIKAIMWEELQRLYWVSTTIESTWRGYAQTEVAHLSAAKQAAEDLTKSLLGV